MPIESTRTMSGRAGEIGLHTALLLLPMLVFSGILLGLIFAYQVTASTSGSNDLDLRLEPHETGIFYVNFSATRLIFIASWSSTTGPLLVGSGIVLISYPAAQKILLPGRTRNRTVLPTPYQLVILLEMLSGGGFGALWTWLKYVVNWKRNRSEIGQALATVSSVLVVMLSLSFIVFLADTWLHVTTSSILLAQMNAVTPLPSYSFQLRNTCLDNRYGQTIPFQPNTMAQQCAVNIAGDNTYIMDAAASYAVLGNISDTMTAVTLENNVPFVYLGPTNSPSRANVDYRASTFGIQTQCLPISRQCSLNAFAGCCTPYYCTPSFQGDVTQDQWQMVYCTDHTLVNNDTFNAGGVGNPYYFGWAVLLNKVSGFPVTLENEPEVIRASDGGVAVVLACHTTVYDVEYDVVNGTVTRFVSETSNSSIANIVQLPMDITSTAEPYLQQYASLAAYSDSAQEIADKMALSYSKAALSISAQAMKAGPALEAQMRTSILVARVPKAPLFTLVGANLLFVVVGTVLFGVVATVPAVVREAQARLSIAGLMSYAFETNYRGRPVQKIEELFEENEGLQSIRIGIQKSDSAGYMYRAVEEEGYMLRRRLL